jgi:hypothetical protein
MGEGINMSRVRIYFMEIIDIYGQKHQIKSDNYEKIWHFVKRHKGVIKALHSGSKTVSESKFEEIKKEENFK